MTETYKRNPNVNCLVCGKSVYRRPAQLKANGGRAFCGITCYSLACRKEKPCTICGKLLRAGLNKKTCSRACSNIQRTGIKYKILSPNDKVKNYKSLKIRLLECKGRSCERCGYSKYEILQVHHKNRDRNNNDFKNLELICPNCHYEEHFLEKSWLKARVAKQ
ncbi:MAG: HNH endonuclease [bacterium]|nr:HNH endonuclease [bacterium]